MARNRVSLPIARALRASSGAASSPMRGARDAGLRLGYRPPGRRGAFAARQNSAGPRVRFRRKHARAAHLVSGEAGHLYVPVTYASLSVAAAALAEGHLSQPAVRP